MPLPYSQVSNSCLQAQKIQEQMKTKASLADMKAESRAQSLFLTLGALVRPGVNF